MRIVVPTSPKYRHILPTFNRAFLRAWPDCAWPVDYLDPLEDRGWAANLLDYLGDSDDPLLLLLDDYILDAVDTELMLWASKLITLPGVGMVRVHPCPGPTQPWPGADDIGLIDKARPYAISLQAAIWKPAVIRDLFRADENPWQTEIAGSARARIYDRFQFLGTRKSAIGYRELMKRGQVIPEAQAWVEANL